MDMRSTIKVFFSFQHCAFYHIYLVFKWNTLANDTMDRLYLPAQVGAFINLNYFNDLTCCVSASNYLDHFKILITFGTLSDY